MPRSAFVAFAIAIMSAASLYGAAGRGFSEGRNQGRWSNLDAKSHVGGVALDPQVLDGGVAIIYSLRFCDVGKDLRRLSGFYGQYVGQRCQVVVSLREERCDGEKWKSVLDAKDAASGKIGVYRNLRHSAMAAEDNGLPNYCVVTASGEAVYSGDKYASAVKAAKKALAELPEEDAERDAASIRARGINAILRLEDVRPALAVVELARHVSKYPVDRNEPRLKPMLEKVSKDEATDTVMKFIAMCEKEAATVPRSPYEKKRLKERLEGMMRRIDNMKKDGRLKKYVMIYEARLALVMSRLEER